MSFLSTMLLKHCALEPEDKKETVCDIETQTINPANGLPMLPYSGIDVIGNPLGQDNHFDSCSIQTDENDIFHDSVTNSIDTTDWGCDLDASFSDDSFDSW